MSDKVTSGDMAVMLVDRRSKAERYIALPEGLTPDEADAYGRRYCGQHEEVCGVYEFR